MADIRKQLLKIDRKTKKMLKEDLPVIVKTEGLDFIHDNFDRQGFESVPGLVDYWPKRKPPQVWRKRAKKFSKSQRLSATKAGGKYLKDEKNNRAILVKRGHLRSSWDQDTNANDRQVEFTSSRPYAEAHNEGENHQPERRMIGPSTALDKRIKDKLDREMDRLLG